MERFDGYSEKAIKAIMLAQDESRNLGRYYVGTEHIMLGLIGEGTGVAAKTLESQGVALNTARVKVENIAGRGSGSFPMNDPFSPRAKRVLELARDEAKALGASAQGSNYIGTEHLLLGLVRLGSGVGMQVLNEMGIDPIRIREHVLGQLDLPQAKVSTPITVRPAATISTAKVKICPNCAESIKPDAKVCHFCDYGISNEHFVDCKFCKERVRTGATKCRYCLKLIGDSEPN